MVVVEGAVATFKSNWINIMKKLTLVISLLAIFGGCGETEEQIDTEEVLLSLLDQDDVTGMDGFGSDGDADLDHEVGLETGGVGRTFSDTLSFGEGYRIRFGRRITNNERTVNFEINGETAIGLVTHTVTGEFIAMAIDTSNHEQIDSLSFTKDFLSTFNRKVRFIQVEDADNPDGYSWKIDAITPITGGSGDKVSISDLSVYALTDSLELGDLLYFYESDGLGDLFIDRDSLPAFMAFGVYVVGVTVENTGPEYALDTAGVGEWVLLNYGRNRNMRGRRHLNDRGLTLDAVMNDNIHTGGWRAHGPGPEYARRAFRSFFETIDLATIFVSDGGYNTAVWSIPYRIERP